MMKKGITVAGNLIVDIVKNIDSYPNQGMLANIRNMTRCIGGCAGNTVMDLAIIDESLPLTCLGKVGSDESGEYILDLLQSRKINIAGIKRSPKPTSFTDVMNSLENGQRTFFHNRGSNEDFSYADIDFSTIDSSIFHIGYALLLDGFDCADDEFGTVMAKTLASVREKGIKTSLDVVSENSNRFKNIVIPSLKYCSYAIMNEVEAGMVTGIEPRDSSGGIMKSNLKEICTRMLEFGVEDYVILHMPEMGCAMNRSGAYTTVGAYDIPKEHIKGTVGAGDAFCAGMLYALYHGWEMEKALVFAHGAAACNLSSEDSISGMKDKDHIMTLPYALRDV